MVKAMARKTHWKARSRSEEKRRRKLATENLLVQIFGKRQDCCTPENPCYKWSDDDWIRSYIDEFPYLR